MSNPPIGEVDIHPWLPLAVETDAGRRDLRFLVDTGFDGELAIPRSYWSWFGVSDRGFDVQYADGESELAMIVSCRVEWLDGLREVTAVYIGGPNPLIVMELLDDCVATLEIQDGRGEIRIESP